jgi:hypothetical protein
MHRAAAISCPPHRLEDDRKCIPYVEDKDIAGIGFSLYTWTDPDTLPDSAIPAADPGYLEPLQAAAVKSLPVYASLMKTKVKAINVYLTEDSPKGLAPRGVTDFMDTNPSVCSIRITGIGMNEKSDDIKSVEKTLAHELYHCVQKIFGISRLGRDHADWWFEGSTEYFANVFYPNTVPDHMACYFFLGC